jgi:hypothetical protein
MPLDIPNLLELETADVEANLDVLTERVQEFDDGIELKRGVVHDLVLHLQSILATGIEDVADRIQRSSSLLEITEDPALADEEVVDAVLSNFRVSRTDGSAAAGTIVIVLDSLTPVTIANGAVFTAQGQTFTADSAFAARVSAAQVVTETDRLLTALGDGSYAFTIEVTATEVGTAAQLKRNVKLVPAATIPRFVTAYVQSDFSGGLDVEDNEAMLSRLQNGIAAQDLSNRGTIDALVRQHEDFEGVLALSTIGYGDTEQRRYHSIFPVAFGGRLDVYARTQALPQALAVTKTATLVSTLEAGGIWQFSLTREDAPGFYEVGKITLASAAEDDEAGYEVQSDVRGYDLTESAAIAFTPDLESAEEAAFSRFSSAVIQFLDTDTPVGALTVGSSTQDYTVVVRVMPQIAALQELLGGRSVRHAAADLLVKAAVPCFLSLSFTIHKKSTEESPDTDALATDLAAEVNQLGFRGRLAASQLSAVIHRHLVGTQTASAIDMFGRIRYPNGTIRYLRSGELLEIPDAAEQMVSPRTVAFILDPADVAASVEVVDTPDI